MSKPEETALLELSDISSATVSIPQSSFDKKFLLLGLSSAVKTVASFEEQESASEVLKNISELLRNVESARKVVKNPILALGKKIDELAKNFTGELEAEKNRISRLIGSFVAEEERKRREAEMKAREETERKAREEAEAARKAREAAQAAGVPAPEPAPAQTVSVSVAPVVQPTRKVAGTRIIKVRRFEIENVVALRNEHPELFSPDEAKIRDYIRGLNLEAGEKVAGLKVWDETKATA